MLSADFPFPVPRQLGRRSQYQPTGARRFWASASAAVVGCVRQLKYRCLLTTTQLCQENNAPIWKFKRIMVRPLHVLIYLSEDCRSVS